MFPVYWQGSVIGAIIGLIVLAVFAYWLIRTKAESLGFLTKRTRWITVVLLPLIWVLSFVNVGIHQTQGDRVRFDQAGQLTEKSTPVVRSSASPESARQAAAETRKEIDAGNLNK
ncbi:hypothetical protein MZD04_gp344 [Pseudomonas phage Psa21]|uniref:Uncharacterized protein n=1 Tax=Pseudomonas phage Psa21 TaxID=2530023 RepID=A0A481W4X0_9CAUD|nr:hypothetical protein MZD04_gp344 [Pseudomonas phage Psa21]QBJ02870.1 hypothetical protein PSA21_344 [Pseudomonas phage Psa21]